MKKHITPENFQSIIKDFYKTNKRTFPWRDTRDPYKILVSELMLQQTQTDRVIPKYIALLEQFPDFATLADTPLTDVLRLWSGLGYNRRAKYLHESAKIVAKEFGGKLPSDTKELLRLPGIGVYTAGAVQAFAFNMRAIFIETNIRRVFIHTFFEEKDQIHDKEIIQYITDTLPQSNIAEWYYALMDYGAFLGRTLPNPNKKSKSYIIQSPFKGSRREIRGKLLRLSLQGKISPTHPELAEYTPEIIFEVFEDLKREGLVDSD
jgi:A/G-specific adenine glycosylase